LLPAWLPALLAMARMRMAYMSQLGHSARFTFPELMRGCFPDGKLKVEKKLPSAWKAKSTFFRIA
jgi:hypothetical protein